MRSGGLAKVGAAAVGAAAVFVGMVGFAAVGAVASPPTDHQVTICHGTDSNTNPYVQETVDVASGGLKGGHEGHTGPVWNAGLKDQHIAWGDIIPAFSYDEFTFAGLNVTSPDGAAIYNNNCNIPATVVPGAPTATQSVCVGDAPSAPTLAMPVTDGITYSAQPAGPYTAGQSVTVTAAAVSPGHWFQSPGTQGWTFVDLFTETYALTFDAAPNCNVEPTVVAPEVAVSSTPTCEVPDITVTLPVTPGVIYTPNGSLDLSPGQSVTITPTAAQGYVLAGGSQPQTITNLFNIALCTPPVPIMVTPQDATASTPTCENPTMTVTLPSTEGVTYTPSGSLHLAPGHSVTITAAAAKGYELNEESSPQTITNTFDEQQCQGVLPISVVRADAASSTATCDNPTMTVTLPTTTGVVYRASGSLELAPGDSVTITPTAAEGYVLADGTTAQTITNGFDVSACKAVEPQPPVTQPSSGPLAHTGAGPIGAEIAWGLGALLAGAVLTVATRRRDQV